ncbi:cation:proton antiporter [Methanolobus psychrotolerans]|uniref:cation:proton antiporter n=1 Tax=Methanolobus psychrotolerans TaxID=1874706 RepID=UPI000B916812|nr:cation:proton antiporter [Methanolobus psychrotolerans]
MFPGLPIHEPVLIFALSMLVFLIAPLLLKLFRLPGMIGIIIVGAFIGPNALHILDRNETIILLGEIGLVYLMFIAGLEININKFIEKIDRSLVFGIFSFIIPQLAGTAAGYYILGLSFPAALLFASIFASHTLLAYPVIKRLGIVNNEAITVAVGGTIMTDTMALMVLAVVVPSLDDSLDMFFWIRLGLGLTLFFVGSWLIVPRIARWFFSKLTDESYFEFLFVMAVAFVIAYFAEVAGVEPIIGAFLAGLLLNRLIPSSSPLMNRIEFVGNALFIPFFLLSVGMLVNIRAFVEGGHQLTLAIWMIGLVLITKLGAAWITGRMYRYGNDQIMSMFGLSVGQAAAALAIVLIGFKAGLFNESMINAVVMMMLVVAIISPQIVERYGSRVSLTDKATYNPAEIIPRILVSFSAQSTYKQLLMDLALMIRDRKSDEPLNVLSVVKRDAGNSEKMVAEAEKMLQETLNYAACAEVPVNTHVRLNYNIASGIMGTVIENRISTVVIGWDGVHSPKENVIGSIIDQLLRGTEKLVLVSMIRHPLCNTQEITLIIPHGIDHNTGLYSVVDTIRRISEGTSAPVKALVVGDDPAIYKEIFNKLSPDLPISFEGLGGWRLLLDMLHARGESPHELIISLSTRRDTPGWHPMLQVLPRRITSYFKGNLIIAYPPIGERPDDLKFFGIE